MPLHPVLQNVLDIMRSNGDDNGASIAEEFFLDATANGQEAQMVAALENPNDTNDPDLKAAMAVRAETVEKIYELCDPNKTLFAPGPADMATRMASYSAIIGAALFAAYDAGASYIGGQTLNMLGRMKAEAEAHRSGE